MAVTTYPGVYIQEVSSGVRPIAAASTSVAAFLGEAEKGEIGKAVKIYNFTEYQNKYGDFLDHSDLTHAVYQFFNNGGSECYIVRVTGENTETASIVLNDRAASGSRAESLTISARSPGEWGNALAVVIEAGTLDPVNEFNLTVYEEEDGQFTELEAFENLSMTPTTPNFVEAATASSLYIVVAVNDSNANVAAGTSRGADAPASLEGTGQTRLRININNDGHQEVDLQDGVGGDSGQAADLSTAANIATALQFVVGQLERQHESTAQGAFDNFTCGVVSVDVGGTPTDVLLLTSGEPGPASSVRVLPAADGTQDASFLLNLGALAGGQEMLGGAVTQPVLTADTSSERYFVGDDATATGDGTGAVRSVTLGSDGDPVNDDNPFLGAFGALDPIEDVSLLAVPGRGSSFLMGEAMSYCENRPLSDCFFIGDMAPTDNTVEAAQTFWQGISPKNSYGAVYLPWMRVPDPTGQSAEPILVPPSGFVAGLYAKTDAQRGVWKAPAGTAAALSGAIGLDADFTDVQQGNLNPKNINVIRRFNASGIVLWGARTITSDAEWQYIPVRRVAIMLRVSIYNGIQWAVFEPNDEPLWAALRLNIGAFMNNLFRQGAFQGATPSEAYFVKCDSETTTQADIDLGIVNVLVGFAPLKPAEFVVVKISQKAGQTA